MVKCHGYEKDFCGLFCSFEDMGKGISASQIDSGRRGLYSFFIIGKVLPEDACPHHLFCVSIEQMILGWREK